MAQPLQEEEGARVRVQKAAAWQWLMRGGAPAEAPLPVEPSVRGSSPMVSSGCRRPSRFAHEAALLPRLPQLHNVDLPCLTVSGSAANHCPQKLGQQEASRISVSAEKEARMVQPSDRRALHLHFLGFQKFLRKLMPSPSRRKSTASAHITIGSESDKDAQHHYHGYIYHHHHHHHHYNYDGAGSPTCLTEQTMAQTRRRQHSESGAYRLAQKYHLCAESEAGILAGGQAPVKTQTINELLSLPIERTVSERFAYTTTKAQFSDEDDETHSRVARCNSDIRRPLHLHNRIIPVDAQSRHFQSGLFFD